MIIKRIKCDQCKIVSMSEKMSTWTTLLYPAHIDSPTEDDKHFCPECGPVLEKTMTMLHIKYIKEGHKLEITEE